MSNPPVEPQEIRRIYADLAEDVLAREDRLQQNLPVEETAGIHAHLRTVVEDWETDRKSLRTVPVANVYTRHLQQPLDDSIKQSLTGLDATVNVLDDIIDTRTLTTQSRIALTVNAAFSALLTVEQWPQDKQSQLSDLLREYYTALFQIPLVEQRLFDSMQTGETPRKRQNAAKQIYAYRGRDIDIFARLPAVVTDVESETQQRLLDDLRSYRARRLLFKDLHDVERDLDDGDLTPVIHFLRSNKSIDTTATTIERVYDDFTYSDVGAEQYGDILRKFERAPEDLQAVLESAQETVSKNAP